MLSGVEIFNFFLLLTTLVYNQIFRGEGVVDEEGGSSEGCLKWGGGGGGSLRDFSKNI